MPAVSTITTSTLAVRIDTSSGCADIKGSTAGQDDGDSRYDDDATALAVVIFVHVTLVQCNEDISSDHCV